MALELNICKELASINVTLSELVSVSATINTELSHSSFGSDFNDMVAVMTQAFDVVPDNLLVFSAMTSLQQFVSEFDAAYQQYKSKYLLEISKPRNYGEQAYEIFLELKTRREMKTSYPLLKRSFERLDHLVDKWINNDAWLAMSIDNLFKRMQQLLNEIATLKAKDPEDAFIIYHAAFTTFSHYINLIVLQRNEIAPDICSSEALPVVLA